MVKVITFDAGNTLFRLVEPAAFTYARLARGFGQTLDPARLDRAFRQAWTVNERLPDIDGPRPDDGRSWWSRLVKLTLSSAGYQIEPYEYYFDQVYREFAKPGIWALQEDTIPVLQNLKQRGIRLGIISNFDCRLYTILDLLGLTHFFEHILISTQVGADKPSRRIFDAAVGRFAVQPFQILHVGDEAVADGEGATNAGLQSLVIDHRRTPLKVLFAALS
jgi:putative hydrolase of the HAD superfamily